MTTPIAGADEVVNEFEGLSFKFKRLSTYQPGESWVLLFYGPSKTGKTYFAGTAGPRTLYLNVGEGIETLMAPAFTKRYPDAKNMIMLDLREEEATAQAFDNVCSAIDVALKSFPEKFDTVILDEATAFRKFALAKAMSLNNSASRGNRAARGTRLDNYVKADVDDFGIEMDMVKWFLGEYIPIFKGAKKHFVMLAHERQTFNKPSKVGDDASLKRVLPGFTGKTFPDEIPAYFDDVWHSEVVGGGNNVVYRARTAGDETQIGGARHGGIFQVVEQDPNFLAMLARIKQSQPRK